MHIYLIHRNKQRSSQNGKTKKKSPNEEQENSLEEELNEMEASNLSDTEFKVMRIPTSMKKDIETIKKDMSE